MNRRHFIKSGLSLSALLATSGFTHFALADTETAYAQAFNQALASNKRLRGWQGVSEDIEANFIQWQGKLPTELIGHSFYRNGPGRQQLGGERYSHWFDGDGFVNHYALGQQGVTHSGKFVRTRKFEQESKAGHFLYHGAGSRVRDPHPLKGPESVNTANIALLPVNGELWALWEAAMPYRLAASDLSTLGQVKLADELQDIPFSAHPHKDQNGSIWNIGDLSYLGKPAFVLYQLSAQGKLLQYKVIDSPRRSYVHDFAMTDNHLIIYLPPLFAGQNSGTLIESFEWKASEGGVLLVIDKNDLSIKHQIACEAGFVFHFGNCWQQKNELVINCCWYHNADIMTQSMNDIIHSFSDDLPTPAYASKVVINLNNGKTERQNLGLAMEFPQFDSRFTSQANRYQFGVSMGGASSSTNKNTDFNAISRLDLHSGLSDSYQFAKGTICEEPLFVTKQGGQEGQGYLVHTSLDYENGHTQLSILDAEHLANGPVAHATLPYYLPLGFHGAFI
jgi:all-trans-8'-apo-beta-carotenal 15,15'-oxygenase